MGKKDKKVHSKVKGTEMVFSSLSLPASLVEDLKLLRDCYEETWKEGGERERVTYEKVFERLLSKSGLGHVDPDVYKEFLAARETRKKLPEVVTRATRKIVDELAARAQENGTSLKEEARKEQARAVAEVEALRAKRTEKRFVHPDGRWFPATMGTSTWVPVDPVTNKWISAKPLKEQGFELKDVEI